jgi:hypothetical protein
MTRYSERSKFHPTSTPLSADLKKKIISESRVRKQGFNPQLQNGKNPEFNHQPLAKANYFSSNHDDSGFMEREEDTPPISYLVSVQNLTPWCLSVTVFFKICVRTFTQVYDSSSIFGQNLT